MTAKECKEKAIRLQNELKVLKSQPSFDGKNREDIIDEFIHLIFFFSPEIPMLKEMQSADIAYPGFTKFGKNPEKYMERFIHYLDEFCED